ncbi:MAG: hypothetical protein ACK49N_12135 [Verrucomicrobiota bacterium]
MKSKFPLVFLPLLFTTAFGAEGLYYTGTEAQESLPIKWLVGGSLIYDDNVSAGQTTVGGSSSSLAVNPYVGASFVSLAPQTTWDVYGRLGMIYYFDAPEGIDDLNSQSRVGVSMIHRFSERVRFVSRNFVANELEPDYSYGLASSRQSSEFMSWSTDNSLGYRWTERFGTYTGIRFSGSSYSDDGQQGNLSDLSDRMNWQVYEQLRYQYSPQTVLITEYRYGQTLTDSIASESTDQYFLVGADHRFSPNTIGTVRTGAQLRDVDGGSSATSPYLEFALNSQINPQLRLGAFMRYGLEGDDTVLNPADSGDSFFNYDERSAFRLGVTGGYMISPDLSLNSGLDVIHSNYDSGRQIVGTTLRSAPSVSETTVNASIGMSVKLTDFLYGNLSYNYSQVVSDVNDSREYDRNRVSVGVSAEF